MNKNEDSVSQIYLGPNLTEFLLGLLPDAKALDFAHTFEIRGKVENGGISLILLAIRLLPDGSYRFIGYTGGGVYYEGEYDPNNQSGTLQASKEALNNRPAGSFADLLSDSELSEQILMHATILNGRLSRADNQ